MERHKATEFCRDQLIKHGLTDWKVRLTTDASKPFLGLCSYKDKCIILNAHHCDIHPDLEVIDTIYHEIAHALTPGHGHDETWRDKAKELGCTNTQACSHLSFTPAIIDAIRSGATVEVEFDEQIIRTPKYKIQRLQDKCEKCGAIAKQKHAYEFLGKKYILLECGHNIAVELPKATPYETLISYAWKEHVKNCKHEFNGTQCINCGEFRPFPYQVEGMRFIENALTTQRGAAVFDEMGLGKTVQSLGFLKFHEDKFPIICFVKSGIKFQFYKEFLRWVGLLPSQVISSGSDYIIPGLKAYFMSYDILTPKSRTSKTGKKIVQGMPLDKVLAIGAKTIILDECQQIKNPDSTRTQMIRAVCREAKHVIPLSGTPWKNRGSEFFVVLNMLDPKRFWSYKQYIDKWVDTYYDGPREKEGGIREPEKFKEYVKDIVIRRERQEVMKELPTINRVNHFCDLDQITQKQYDEEVSEFVKWYNQCTINGEDPFSNTDDGPIVAKLAKMRHIAGLAKIPQTEELVEQFVEETDRKLVVFAHHQDVQHILYNNLKSKFGHLMPVLRLTGGMSSEHRFSTQEEFNASPRAILVGSTLAAGEGLNLQTCSDCIMHEPQWNPANEEQAEGRFIRIGQKATCVTGTYVTAAGTVDELLRGIVERKRLQFHNAMNKGEMPVWVVKDIIRELVDGIVDGFNKKNKNKKVS